MKVKTYNQALQALLSLTNLPSKQYMSDPKACEIYLKRLQWVLDELGNPEGDLRFVHIAGTSGKGSVAIMLHEILRAAGYKVGTYTSPYVSAFTERIRVNTKLIHTTSVVEATNAILPAIEASISQSPYGPPSYFETLVAVALWHFNKQNCDFVILEAGCGGKYDATNVIPAPVLALVTNVGLDHTELLGKTRSAIARRKAGVFKKGSIALIGEKDPAIEKILNTQAKSAGVRTIISSKQPTKITHGTNTLFRYQKRVFQTKMTGAHQAHNAALAIEASRALRVSWSNIATGLRRAQLPGRFEIMDKSPTIILDGAHNEDKIEALVKALDTLYGPRRLHCIIGATDHPRKLDMFDRLIARATTVAATRFTTTARTAQNPHVLAEQAIGIKPEADIGTFLFPKDALRWTLKQAQSNDIIVVTGSLYLVGELRSIWKPENTILVKRTPFV